MTAYYPVVSPAGKVIGVLYVGLPMAQFDAMLAEAIWNMARGGCRGAPVAAPDHADRAAGHKTAALGNAIAHGDC
jgi:hypothetical protein